MIRNSYWANEPNMVHNNNAEKKSRDFSKLVASALGIIFVVGVIIAGLIWTTTFVKLVELEVYQAQQAIEELNWSINNIQ